ncbi:hypothetical protein ACJMK2_015467, partial [Sinanodonta woodiana]
MGYAWFCNIFSVILSLCFTHLLGLLEFSPRNGELFSIVINNDRLNVFVGGHNKLYNLTKDLQLSREYDACELVNSSRDVCDSDVKVVKENIKSDYMLICGTVAYGACAALYRNGTYSPFIDSTINHSTAKYVGSKSSVFAFFGHDFFGDSLLYVAMGYDGRPLEFYPYTISERRVHRRNGIYQLLYYDKSENYTMTPETLNSSYFDFLYGFEDLTHSYFISNQNNGQEGIISQSCNETNIARQYIETKITCGGSYYIADAFFIGSDNISDKRTLYVVFYDNATDTSRLCSYPQNVIHEYFRSAVWNCNQHLKIPWMAGSYTSCNQPRRDNACNMEIIMRVKDELSASPVYLTAGRVTALTARVEARLGQTVFIGFDNGILKKVHPITNRTLLVTDVAKNKTLGIRRGGLVINDRDQVLYVLCKTKVVLFPLDSCEVYNNCRDCIADLDHCGWCMHRSSNLDRCTKVNECTSATWYKNTCKPRISDVFPNSGPTAGGTLVTISGDFVAESSSSVTVTICNTTCEVNINNTTTDKIQCVTNGTERTEDCDLTVTSRDRVHSNYRLSDSARYKYKKPEAKDIKPTFGPLSGGIPLTVIGLNLDVGSTCHVLVGDKECQLIRRSEKEIICKIPSWNNATNATDCNLFIDNERLRPPNNFRYVPNPIVRDIKPRTFIKSGGTNITLTGSNLNAVGPVFIAFTYGIYVQRGIKECSFSFDGTTMICATPAMAVSDTVPHNVKTQFSHIRSAEDASRYFCQPPSKLIDLDLTVVEDPKVDGDKTEFVYDAGTANDNYTILIQGEDFDFVDPKEISVYVGADACRIVDVSAKNISCIPSFSSYIGQEMKLKIKILCGENLDLSGGFVNYRGKLKSKDDTPSTHITLIVSLVGGLVLFIIVIIIAMLFMKNLGIGLFRKKWQPVDFVVEYSSGRSRVQGESSLENASVQNRENDYQEQTFSKSMDEGASLLSGIDEDLLQTLKGDNLIIERDNLVLGELLGQGHFGCVYKGYLQVVGVKEERIVAVKTLHIDGQRDMDVNGFLKEALIMKDFHHKHVMELVGICVGLDKMPLVVLPYLRHGDLLTYIRDKNN